MRHVPLHLDVFNAAQNGERAREAAWRATLARPDAEPLPEEPPRSRSWLAAILRRAAPPTPATRRATEA